MKFVSLFVVAVGANALILSACGAAYPPPGTYGTSEQNTSYNTFCDSHGNLLYTQQGRIVGVVHGC